MNSGLFLLVTKKSFVLVEIFRNGAKVPEITDSFEAHDEEGGSESSKSVLDSGNLVLKKIVSVT